MNIKKSDPIQFSQNVNSKQDNNQTDSKVEKTSETPKPEVTVDSLRNRVLSLQSEVHEIQTGMSFRRIQLGFLSQMQNGNDWQKELQRYMKDNFQGAQVILAPANSKDEYIEAVNNEIGDMKNSLIHKEVQLQNIMSTGIISELPDQPNASLIKDFEQSREVFSRLRPDTIQNLLGD